MQITIELLEKTGQNNTSKLTGWQKSGDKRSFLKKEESSFNETMTNIDLNEKEVAFIKEWYPNVDVENLFLPAIGMSSVTSLELLDSSLKYDIENQKLGQFPNPLVALNMMTEIKKKIDIYKSGFKSLL